jgi:hypothetical protein
MLEKLYIIFDSIKLYCYKLKTLRIKKKQNQI